MPCIRSSRAVELIMRLRLLRTASGLALAIVGSACVLSVDPVVSESGAVFDARLLGTWSAESDSDRVSVTRLNETTYAIEYTADGKRGRFEARLGKLSNRMVLDAWAVPGDSDVKEPYRDMLIPGHMLLALGIGADTVSTAVLDHSALRSALGARVVTLAQVSSKDQVILTGRTAELRAGLAGYVDRTGAWDKPQRWRRVTTRSSAASGTPTGASPIPCFEASARRDAAQQFLSIQTAGFGSADVMIRAAPAFVGPWSSPRMLYRPSEYYRPNAMIYAAKAHPELTGADLVLTYATNTFKFGEHLTDSLIYYPRFVRLTRCP